MTFKRTTILWWISFCWIATASAQNLNFSQYHQTPFLTNPALVASSDALQGIFSFRQQRSLSGQKYSTPMLSLIYPFLKSTQRAQRAGIGLSVLQDQEGTLFINQGVMLALAYNLQLGNFKGYPFQLSAGTQVGYFSRRIDMNQFVTGNQITSGGGIGENFQQDNLNMLSFAGGLYGHVTDEEGLPILFLGIATHNLNEPKGSFLDNANPEVQLARRLNFSAGYRVFRSEKLSITPNIQVENLNNSTFVRGGAWFRYHWGTSSSNFLKKGNIGSGVWYNSNGATTLSLEWNQPAYFVSFSYDLGLGANSQAWQSGSPEIHLGIRKVLKRRAPKDTDKDGVPDKVDACPQVAGLPEFKGCPDTDKDGIPDKDDACPQIAGLAMFKGCPDTDKDGVPDNDDACPQIAGLPEFKGCPDTDKDGIPDKDDACPQIAGLPEFKGCPDTDKDGIPDKDDTCPQIAGLPEFKGCPDTDKDGVPDKEDACPQVPGLAELKGCPPVKINEPDFTKLAGEIRSEVFDYRSAVLNPGMLPKLDELIKQLANQPQVKLRITGHTDHLGEQADNQKLSLERAKAVKAYLATKGLKNTIEVRGEGENQPLVPNTTEAGRSKNRRVDITLITKGK